MSGFSEQLFELVNKPFKKCEKCGQPGDAPYVIGKKISIYGK